MFWEWIYEIIDRMGKPDEVLLVAGDLIDSRVVCIYHDNCGDEIIDGYYVHPWLFEAVLA